MLQLWPDHTEPSFSEQTLNSGSESQPTQPHCWHGKGSFTEYKYALLLKHIGWKISGKWSYKTKNEKKDKSEFSEYLIICLTLKLVTSTQFGNCTTHCEGKSFLLEKVSLHFINWTQALFLFCLEAGKRNATKTKSPLLVYKKLLCSEQELGLPQSPLIAICSRKTVVYFCLFLFSNSSPPKAKLCCFL